MLASLIQTLHPPTDFCPTCSFIRGLETVHSSRVHHAKHVIGKLEYIGQPLLH